MTAPERIWARPDYNECWPKRLEEEDVEYIRADLAAVQPAQVMVSNILKAAGEEYVLEHVMETDDHRMGRKSTVRGMMVRLGLYPELEGAIDAALEPQPDPRDEVINGMGPIADLLPDAVAAAEKAMRKYPQPNYVISKWAEETGEVTKDLIHMAEGRQTVEKLRGEIVQSLAMLHRLLVEGDQVHGLPPISAALAAAKAVQHG